MLKFISTQFKVLCDAIQDSGKSTDPQRVVARYRDVDAHHAESSSAEHESLFGVSVDNPEPRPL